MSRFAFAALLLMACGGDDGGDGDAGGGDAGGGEVDGGAFQFTATGTRDGTPFTISRPCFSRLERNQGTAEAWDASLELGFKVHWERGTVAGTYPNDNSSPEVLVFVIHIVDGNDINEGTQQGTVTFDVLGDAIGAEAAGRFDDIVLDRISTRVDASGTFRCLLN